MISFIKTGLDSKAVSNFDCQRPALNRGRNCVRTIAPTSDHIQPFTLRSECGGGGVPFRFKYVFTLDLGPFQAGSKLSRNVKIYTHIYIRNRNNPNLDLND